MVIPELDITIHNHCDEVLFMKSVWMYAKSSTGWRRLLLDTSRPELELCQYQILPLRTGLGKTIPSHTEYISSSREGFCVSRGGSRSQGKC